MGNDRRTTTSLDRIDTEMFYHLLSDKLGHEQLDVVTAALAESVGRGGVLRVLGHSTESRNRMATLRKRLRAKIGSVTKG